MTNRPCNVDPPNPPEVENLFPPGSVPENRTGMMSALCSLGTTDLILAGALRQALLQHFVDPDHITNPTLREMFVREGGWKPTPDSGLYIELVERFEPQQIESRPAILIKCNDFKEEKLGIGHLADENMETGLEVYEYLWRGSITFMAISTQAGELRLLAAELQQPLLGFRSKILYSFELTTFDPAGRGSIGVLEESNKNFCMPVDYTVAFSERFEVQPEAPRWKDFSIDLDTLLR